MIIIISEVTGDKRSVIVGDTFELSHNLKVERNGEYHETIRTKVLSAEVTMDTYVDYYAIYVFAEDDGTVTGNNMCGLFGKKENIPKEIQNATHLDNLTPYQRTKFDRTCPIRSEFTADMI